MERSVWAKLAWRLIVPIAFLTFVNSIDRVNVSYAGAAMSAELGLSQEQFGLGVSAFFLAYLLFQYPHVLLLKAWGIKRWLFGSILLWAVSGFWMAHLRGEWDFYAARFLLGTAEAGFAPGMTWLISRWAPPAIRARALAGALVAVPLSMVLGGPLCGWLLGIGNPLDMASWRYMFLMIAIPNVVLAFIAAAYFIDTPDKARWLTNAEKQWLAGHSGEDGQTAPPAVPLAEVLREPWLWRCSAIWLLVMTGSYALVFWLPQLVRSLDIGGSELAIGTLSATPMAGLALGLVLNSRRSDRTGERLWHTAIPSAVAGVLLLVAALLEPGLAVLGLLVLVGFGIGATQGVFWAIPGAVGLGGGKQVPVSAIAIISMAGTAGGIIGPWLVGALSDRFGSFSVAIAVLATMLVLPLAVIAQARMRGATEGTPA